MNFEETEGKLYEFTINTIGFIKSFQKSGLNDEKIPVLAKLSAKLYQLYADIQEDMETKIILDKIKICSNLAADCRNLLQSIKCDDNKALMNEKIDLTIEASDFHNLFNNYLLQNQQ